MSEKPSLVAFAEQLDVPLNFLSPIMIHSFFLSQTRRRGLLEGHAKELAANPAIEREKTLWRINDIHPSFALRWKVFLSSLPPSSENWAAIASEQLVTFREIARTFERELKILARENPLESYGPDVLLTEPRAAQDRDLRLMIWEIKKDVRRTHFRQNVLAKRFILHKLVLLYQLHTGRDYIQGMNEIMAVIIEVMLLDNADAVEVSTFFLFSDLMGIMADWFQNGDEGVVWIRQRCEVVERLLSLKDPVLAAHLRDVHVEIQLFLLFVCPSSLLVTLKRFSNHLFFVVITKFN